MSSTQPPISADSTDPQRMQKNPCTVAPFNDEKASQRVVSAIARQALEVLNGYRPLQCLSPFLMLEEGRRLQRRSSLVQEYREGRNIKVGTRIFVGGSNICRVNASVVETTTIVRDSIRPRFICMRWELKRGHWRITVLDFG